jgi:membrane protein YdbS with pleckstrin-like domain
MKSLEPGQLAVIRIHAAIAAVIIAVAALVGDSVLAGRDIIPRGLVALPFVPLLFYIVFISPGRHFRSWCYAMDDEELRLRRGVWIETETLVPLDRVQHIDVSQGPIEKAYEVCRLIVHTAGTQHSRVVLPGLSRPDAERMREEIRSRIVAEAE